jgi:ATP-binding cassette, subfamily B, bacterial PglK
VIDKIKIITSLFTREEINIIRKLQITYLFVALFELGNITYIGFIFKSALNDTQNIYIFNKIQFGVKEGLLSLFVTTAATALISIIALNRTAKIGSTFGMNLSSRMMHQYITSDYTKSSKIEKSKIYRVIAVEVQRVSDQIINPMLQANLRIYTILFLTLAAFYQNPIIIITIMSLLIIVYFVLFIVMRKPLSEINIHLSKSIQTRMELVDKCTNALKETKINRMEYSVSQLFRRASDRQAEQRYRNVVFSMFPKYIAELSIILALICALLVGTIAKTEISVINLVVFGIIGLKLVPALQTLYFSITQINGNIKAAHDVLCLGNDLKSEVSVLREHQQPTHQIPHSINRIEILNLDTSNRTGTNGFCFNHVRFEAGHNYAIIGESGVGKTTFLDRLSGLISTNGIVSINDQKYCASVLNTSAWRQNISYISQNIQLFPALLSENLYSDSNIEIDNKLRERYSVDFLSDEILANNQPLKPSEYSGGENQRIGILRYAVSPKKINIFDEVTAALDPDNKVKIISNIVDQSNNQQINIFVTHDVEILKYFDVVYTLRKNGNFDVKRN